MLDIAREPFIESREYMALLDTRRADGMLFIGSSIEDTYLLEFETSEHPFLLVNHYFPDRKLNYHAIDYTACGRLAAEHLLGQGHRAIGLVIGTNTYTGLAFKDAFLRTLEEVGIPEAMRPWDAREWDEQGGYLGAEALLERQPALTAIMGGNDRIAIGAMRLLGLQGRSIPGEVSVMGMDNIPASRFTNPGLTTISLDLYNIGRNACARMLEIIRKEREDCRESVPATLVERESTGPAPAS
jgi:LacI family transcriptional regulator